MNDNPKDNKINQIAKTFDAIKEYLMSIKSVGVKTASRIVYKGRLETLEIIQKDIGLLGKIKGLGPKKEMAIFRAVSGYQD